MRSAALSLAFVSTVALAGCGGTSSEMPCVTMADLNSGIAIVDAGKNNDIVTLRKRIAPDVILSGKYFSPMEDGPSLIARSQAGFFETAHTNFEITGITTYEPDVVTLLPLRDGMQYTSVYDGAVRSRTATTLEIVDADARVSVGGCEYDAIKVTLVEETTAQDGRVFPGTYDRMYLPELMYTALDHDTEGLTVRRLTDADPSFEDF